MRAKVKSNEDEERKYLMGKNVESRLQKKGNSNISFCGLILPGLTLFA